PCGRGTGPRLPRSSALPSLRGSSSLVPSSKQVECGRSYRGRACTRVYDKIGCPVAASDVQPILVRSGLTSEHRRSVIRAPAGNGFGRFERRTDRRPLTRVLVHLVVCAGTFRPIGVVVFLVGRHAVVVPVLAGVLVAVLVFAAFPCRVTRFPLGHSLS